MIISYSNLIRGYSKAIFDIADKLNFTTEYLILLKNLADLFKNIRLKKLIKNHRFLINLINDPIILNKLFSNSVDNKEFNNFINLLLQKKHWFLIPKIYTNYEKIYLQKTNSLEVNLTTAIPITPNVQTIFKDQLFKHLKKNLLLSYNVDQSILAGIVIKFNDRIIDHSFKSKLLQLQANLKNN